MFRRESLTDLFASLKAGNLSRRDFVRRAGAAGLSAAGIAFVVNSVGANAQDGTPAAGGPAAATGRPEAGFENATRGQGGKLNILMWQAATHLSPHNATGDKDSLAASFVLESLMNYLPDGTLVPTLISQLPSLENGQLAQDYSSVTYSLLPDVVWSDGEPFTAKDVKFTWEWVMNPVHAAVTSNIYSAISAVDVVDDLTVKFTFTKPTLAWYVPFTGSSYGQVYPGHLWNYDAASTDYDNTFRQNPTGTGPYKVNTFAENDQVTYVLNDSFRYSNKPYFSEVNLKGGGDAPSAARAVLQTGEYDYAWNLQVEPEVLNDLLQSGKGYLNSAPGSSIETIFINFSDPNVEVDGERSNVNQPHPSFSDKAVRQALASAIDRDTIATQFYGQGSKATPNRLAGIPQYESPNTSFVFDTDGANKLLDDAGWALDGDTRKKGDVELKWTYSTTINSVRQKTQAVVQNNLKSVGIDVELQSVDSGIYFDSAAGNDQNYQHFFQDITMYTNGPTSPFPIDFMANHYAGPNNENVAQKANDWAGANFSRYVNPDYDKMWEEAQLTTDAERAAELFIGMNDLLIEDAAVLPLVQRASGLAAVSNRLAEDNIGKGPIELDFWNIMNWIAVE